MFRLPRIPADKANHFIYGISIYLGCITLLPTYVALIIVLIIGVFKEVYDGQHKNIHTPDHWDAVATTCGGIVGMIISLIS